MAKRTFNLQNRNHDFNIERFKTRLTAKFCVVFVAVTQIIIRITLAIILKNVSNATYISYYLSSFLFAIIAGTVCGEYLVFRKIGPKIMNYSKYIDIILLVTFTAEWMTTLVITLTRTPSIKNGVVDLISVFGFTGFAWRVIFLLFLIQDWKLIIIPPVSAFGLVIGFAIYYYNGFTWLILVTALPQVVYVVLMIYFQDRIRWKEVFTNVQQERWMQVNDFILNNIPENILILELGGEVKFVSDYCKSFMRRLHVTQDPKDLFANIKDLNLQPDTEPSSPSNISSSRHLERFGTSQVLVEPTGNTFANLYQRIDDLEELIKNFKAIIKYTNLQERQFHIYNGKLKVEDHNMKSIEVKISFIQQYGREYLVLILRDTTQRDLLVTLEDNNKYKDQLLASVSHELRAPLNGNINLVECALHSVKIPENIKDKFLTPALRSSKFLLHLINDILDMSQIKAQKLRLVFKPGKIQETLEDTLQLVELQAKKKGVGLLLQIHPDVKRKICTDHVRLSQIVLNLLNNAIKFTQEGSIILSAESTDQADCVKISVKDSGIGMSREETKKLFSNYTHIDCVNRININPTGVGLGLSIASNLAKLLGPVKEQKGIVVESVSGIGSTFSFLLENKEEPIDIVFRKSPEDSQVLVPEEFRVADHKILPKMQKSLSANLLTQTKERLSVSGMAKFKCDCPRILVVDDNPFNTMAFEAVLGSLNIRCDAVFDGQTAIERILERQSTFCGPDCQPYSVVFMDQEMPGMNGSETVRELRRLQVQKLVSPMKIIGCTAHGSVEEVQRFMESGIESCIHKPITTDGLQKILQEYEL